MESSLSKVNCTYGAPMGRTECQPLSTKGVITVRQVAINDGGYDSGGAYWGLPNNLYHCTNEEGLSVFFRGVNSNRVKEKLLKLYPEATFHEILDLETFVEAYLEAAAFLVEDDWIGKVSSSDFTKQARARAEKDCAKFIRMAAIALAGSDMEQAGHDFWLTRNRHGVGFWDRPRFYGPAFAEQLTMIAKSFGECGMFVSRRKKINFC